RLQGSVPCRSIVFRRTPDQTLPPLRAQHVAPFRISLVEIDRVYHAIGAEAAKIVAQLAPRSEQAHRLEIADGDRPDRTLAVAALLGAIAPRDLLALVDLGARAHHVHAVGLSVPAWPRAARRLQHEGTQPLGHGVGDLRHQI